MAESHLSFRGLAHKTKLSPGYLNHLVKGRRPVPGDAVICAIAVGLRVDPDFFLEYRLRQISGALEDSAGLLDAMYSVLFREAPVPDELQKMLEKPWLFDDVQGAEARDTSASISGTGLLRLCYGG